MMFLYINNIDVTYSDVTTVLNGIVLEVKEHQIVALLGANGAGKTTLLKSISGLLQSADGKVVSGEITFKGQRIDQLRPQRIVREGVVQVIEGRKILPHLTVEQNLVIGGALIPSKKERIAMMEKVYDYFPKLPKLRKRVSGLLSGGEQQMLVIGRALMAKPRLLLLDEPSLGLAPLIISDIFGLIARLRDAEGITFLIVEQNANVVLKIADYAYILESGRVVLSGNQKEIRDNEDIREFYLGLGEAGENRRFDTIKSYRRRKRWVG